VIRTGLQIPNFTFPDVPDDQLFERIAAIATTAENAGFDTVMVMDHFFQLPLLGPPENAMFESYTLLGALAARTERARLGALVTGVTYRNPALLAKAVTALDVISGGRSYLGIGAAWFEFEHEALGFDFPPVRERFERLEEALQICRAMLRGERPTFEGTHYRVHEAINSPAPIQPGGPPIMIGGSGEKRTLRLAARYADAVNLIAPFEDLPRKLDVIAAHCADFDRDPAELNKTTLASLVLAPTMEQVDEKLSSFLGARGIDWAALDAEGRAAMSRRIIYGDPDTVIERVQGLLALGLDGICVNMPADAHDLESVSFAGEVLGKAAVA
jgi:F420-dependent oxidoreductase-like protein